MPQLGIAQPPITQLPRPDRNDPTRVRMALEHIQRIKLQRRIEQQLQIVEEQQVAFGVLIAQIPQL